MPKVCDHKSVGMLVWKDEKLLMIERAKFPRGFAVPAGHVDEDKTFEDAARRELKEEVGLDVEHMKLVWEGRVENPCRREGGAWHYWKVYEIKASGDLKRSVDETKQARWYSIDEIKNLPSPGLEPVMRGLFEKLKII